MQLADKNLQILKQLAEAKPSSHEKKRAEKSFIMTKPVYFHKLQRELNLTNKAVGELIGRTDGAISKYSGEAEIPLTVELACQCAWQNLTTSEEKKNNPYVLCIVKCRKEDAHVFKSVAEATGGAFDLVKV